MATKEKSEVGGRKTEFVLRRVRQYGRADYATSRGGWSNNLELAQVFPSEGAARKSLRKRDADIIERPQS
jgi:hypothetical protein